LGASRTNDCHASTEQSFNSGRGIQSSTSLEEVEMNPETINEGELVVSKLED
jgi:hypothetical protein